MDTTQLILALLGWCTLINLGMLVIASVAVVVFGDAVMRIHQKWFGLSEQELRREYFRYLANYKILILMLNLVPYLALRLVVG